MLLGTLNDETYNANAYHAALKLREPGKAEKSPQAPLKSGLSNRPPTWNKEFLNAIINTRK